MSKKFSVKKENLNRCPVCGFTLKDFKDYRFLGCDFCYEYFYPYVVEYLKKIHHDIIYKGKIPEKLRRKKSIYKWNW